jgi:hypothetical protein
MYDIHPIQTEADLREEISNLRSQLSEAQKESNEIQKALNMLKSFCIKKGYDLTELIGDVKIKKPISEMTKEEIIEENKEVVKRQESKFSQLPTDTASFPTFEEEQKQYEENLKNNPLDPVANTLLKNLDLELKSQCRKDFLNLRISEGKFSADIIKEFETLTGKEVLTIIQQAKK